MRLIAIVPLFVCFFAAGNLFAQEKIQKATIAISVSDFGEQKSFTSFADNFKRETAFSIIARCEHLNLMLCEYEAAVYRDQLAVLTYLKSKGFLFEVREGLTSENIALACKQTIHKE